MDSVDAAGLGIGDDHPPRVMGVLNVSEESPYDPSVFDDPGEAAAYVDEELIGEGADVVDVGLESANKRFDVLTAEQELARLDTAVETLESTSGDAVWSIETRYAEVAEAALDAGFDMVNDIAGFADPALPEVCEARDVAVAKMASPPDLERPGAVEETPWAERKGAAWAERADYVDMVYEALKQNGLTEKTIVDPAFGGWSEAQTIEQDRDAFRRLREFRGLGRPMLVSINRKNFLRSLTGRSTADALASSLAATSMAVERGAHVVRTHDVRETVDAVAVGREFARDRARGGDPVVEELDVTTPAEARRHAERLGVDAAIAAESVARIYAVDGVDDDTAAALAAAAADAGVGYAPTTGGGCVLAGSVAAFEQLSAGERDADGALASILSRTRTSGY
ncbi:dihydropteroate synthase [Halorubellus sp. JP-L1]|uniref:dihydropteroate synthase n=1 Tax=Halorubellus sp. JP-L1 TaxID=2715753 RepID=UPI00140C4C74|nr:dihydropteroate synthase [Halorubellus sp. JP-L1]NHN40604.1 dihydropteroate synthase [Halorubellus sp. JP-L1]